MGHTTFNIHFESVHSIFVRTRLLPTPKINVPKICISTNNMGLNWETHQQFYVILMSFINLKAWIGNKSWIILSQLYFNTIFLLSKCSFTSHVLTKMFLSFNECKTFVSIYILICLFSFREDD